MLLGDEELGWTAHGGMPLLGWFPPCHISTEPAKGFHNGLLLLGGPQKSAIIPVDGDCKSAYAGSIPARTSSYVDGLALAANVDAENPFGCNRSTRRKPAT